MNDDTDNASNANEAPLRFEEALKTLESIVTKMERGDLTLEQALTEFETGVALAKKCQLAIQNAEQRLSVLLTEHDPS